MSQILKKWIGANQVDDTKIRLLNNGYLRGRNAANSADIDILKVNASDRIEFGSMPQSGATPSSANDLVNKSYVDAVASGLDVKQSVRVASTANVAITGGASLSIDGVSLANGDRVLLKDQTAGEENGIYVVSGIGSSYALTRASDADSVAEFNAGAFTFVEEGTANADTGWVLTTNDPITLGTTALVFSQFTGAGQIIAGAGLTKSGNTLDVVAADDSIQVNADSIQAKLKSNGGLAVEASAGLKVLVDGLTVKLNGSGQLEGLKPKKETKTLNGTDISNGYVDLAFLAKADSVNISVDGVMQYEGSGEDYSLSTVGGVTRVTFEAGLSSLLASGDKLRIQYMYL